MSTEVTWPERALVKDVAWEKVSLFCIFPAVILLFFVVRKLVVRRASTMHNEQVSNSDGD